MEEINRPPTWVTMLDDDDFLKPDDADDTISVCWAVCETERAKA